jgi:hypothetical protein
MSKASNKSKSQWILVRKVDGVLAPHAPYDVEMFQRYPENVPLRLQLAQPRSGPRHRLYRAICEALYPLDTPAREARVRALREWAGVEERARPTHRALALDELRALAASPGMTIGAHTMTHPALALLPPAAQRRELEASRATLERELGAGVRVVAYPFGTRADVSRHTLRAARAAGFDFAMANEPGAAWRWSSRWRVPRHVVGDWDAGTFGARLEAWLAA